MWHSTATKFETMASPNLEAYGLTLAALILLLTKQTIATGVIAMHPI